MSDDAVLAVLIALDQGGGSQAQFSHPDLGGMGQWSRGGMIMVGDMFNSNLKARVDQLCTELSDLLRSRTFFEPKARTAVWNGSSAWWPADLGQSSSSGSQNDMRYACFPEARRIVVQRDGVVTVYDTGTHRIGGVSQQQSGSQDLTFTSQQGSVRLHELAILGDAQNHGAKEKESVSSPREQAGSPAPHRHDGAHREPPLHDTKRVTSSDDDLFAKIERLHALHQKGILSDSEFAEKKQELLARI